MFLSYVLSFVYVGIYWNNHHHMLHAAEHVDGAVLWANLHLLFWLSLFPFTTGWMGENHFARDADGALRRRAAHGGDRLLGAAAGDHRRARAGLAAGAGASGSDWKGKLSPLLYLVAHRGRLRRRRGSRSALYVAVALIWLVPDTRIEHALANEERPS